MDDFLRRLAPRPSDYGGLPGKITREDDAGNVYDETGRRIFNKFDQTEQPDSWLDTAISTATAPAKLATGLVGSLNPYGQDGWQVPSIISEPAAAFARSGELTGFGDDGQFYLPNVQNPQVAQDTLAQLMTVYGGNALNPLARVPKGGLASGSVKQIGSLADFEAKRKALRLELGLAQLNADHAKIATIRKAMDDLEAQTQKFNMSPEETNSLLDAALAKPKSGTDLTPEDQFFLDMLEKHTNKLLSDNRPSLMGSALASQSIDDQIASITNSTRPHRAAMRFGDEIFTGPNHGAALANAEAKLGEQVWKNWNSQTGYPEGTEGFVTRDGTFLTRNEAARNTPGYYNPDGEMHASSLKDYNLLSDNRPSLMGSALASQADSLPMDQASRLQRARDMGFDTDNVYYHGSQAGDIEAFDMGRADTGWRGKAVHMADHPDLAAFYGGDKYSPGAIYPLYLNVKNTADYMGTSLPREYFSEAQLADLTGYWGEKQAGGFFADGKMTPELASGGIGHNALIDMLKARGFDSMTDNGHMMVFYPSNIRSTSAAFDPARAGENGLLLSDTKPSLLGSALASGQNEEDLLALLGYR